MIRNIFEALGKAARNLFGNWRVPVLFLLLYFALLGAAGAMISLKESSLLQLLLTLLLALLIPALFFLLQAMGVEYTNTVAQSQGVFKTALSVWWKLFLISIPLALLWWGIETGLERGHQYLQEKYAVGADYQKVTSRLNMASSILCFALLYFTLPLLAIQLWIGASMEGAGAALKGMARALLRALSPRSILTYLIGLVIFGVIPYYLLITKTPVENAWMEMSLLGARIALALLLILAGWMVTVGALADLRRNEPVK